MPRAWGQVYGGLLRDPQGPMRRILLGSYPAGIDGVARIHRFLKKTGINSCRCQLVEDLL